MSRLSFSLKNVNDSLQHIQEIMVKTSASLSSTGRAKKRADSTGTNSSTSSTITSGSHGHRTYKQIHNEFSNEENVLNDFILYSNTIESNSENGSDGIIAKKCLPTLALPLIEYNNIRVNLEQVDCPLVSGKILINNEYYSNDSSSSNSRLMLSQKEKKDLNVNMKEMWQKMEEALYMNAFKSTSVPIMFKPQIHIFEKNTDNKQMPKVVVGEKITVMFEMKNHLRINLVLNDIKLLWKFVDQQQLQQSQSQSEPGSVQQSVETTNELEDTSLG